MRVLRKACQAYALLGQAVLRVPRFIRKRCILLTTGKNILVKQISAVTAALAIIFLIAFSAAAEPDNSSPETTVSEHTSAVSHVSDVSHVSEVSHESSSLPESDLSSSEESSAVSVEEESSAVSQRTYYEEEVSEDDTPSKIKKKKESTSEVEEDEEPREKKVSFFKKIEMPLIIIVLLGIAGVCVYSLIRYNRKMDGKSSDNDSQDDENPTLASFSTKGKERTRNLFSDDDGSPDHPDDDNLR